MKKQFVYATLIFLTFCFVKETKSVCSVPSFQTLSSLAVNRPVDLVPADFNRDGITDLAILRDSISPNAGLVQIWLGDGAGNFSWTGVDYTAVQTNVVGFATGEFNQDGLLDLAVVGGPNGNYVVAVLFGNGNGGFSAPTSFPIGSDPVDIAATDFNNDGRMDIITADFNGRVAAILPNNGNGNFGTAITISTGPAGGTNPAPIAIVTGNFNTDNNQDFLTLNNNDTVSVKLGNGNFTFSNPPTIPTNLPGSQQDIEVGDFNGDGMLDFATASYSPNDPSNVVSVRLGTGNGLFTIPTNNPFPVTNSANHLAVADFNADRKLDIVSANNGTGGSNNLSILLNTDNGNFSEAFNFTAEVGRSEKVYAIDFDRNRSPDLLVIKETGDNKIVRLKNTCIFPQRSLFDFDGDGKTDYGVFRPSNGTWYLQNSTSGFAAAQFGISTDKITPADYDGDGKTDIAVFRSGIWYLLQSQNGFAAAQFGQAGDLPVPADYDGDGKADLAVYRPSNGVWYLLCSQSGFTAAQFGISTDNPVPADFDGDGKADLVVYRNGVWYLLQSQNGFAAAQFGIAGDLPVPADFDGDNRADFAVYRNGIWYQQRSQLGFTGFQFGLSDDRPAVGDYDGDGRGDAAVWRPGNGTFYVLQSQSGFAALQFGAGGDTPVASAFVP